MFICIQDPSLKKPPPHFASFIIFFSSARTRTHKNIALIIPQKRSFRYECFIMSITKISLFRVHRKRPRSLLKSSSSIGDASTSSFTESSSSSSSSELALTKKTVQFSTVRIHSHSLIVGDNPAVSKGVPLTLSWTYESSETFSLDQHQASRRAPQKISAYVREQIAQKAGASKQLLMQAREEVREIQRSREQAMEIGFWERIRNKNIHKRLKNNA